MKNETLAQRLGTTAHISPLLMKARRLGLSTPEDFEKLAVRRGCLYYDVRGDRCVVEESPEISVSRAEFSNAELAIALLSDALPSTLLRQRMAAAMLSAQDVDPSQLVPLAHAEHCAEILKYIAKCGADVEPANEFWGAILRALEGCKIPSDGMPHPTRFIEMTGITRGKIGIQKHWIRPVKSLASAP